MADVRNEQAGAALETSIMKIRPVQAGLLYRMHLVATAGTTAALAVAYVAAVGFALLSSLRYLSGEALVALSGGVSLGTSLGSILVFYVVVVASMLLVKPFYAARLVPNEITEILRADDEPRLFEFVSAVADAVAAQEPVEILVSNEVNASVILHRGDPFRSRGRLFLTIGLPLVNGLTVDQLASVLAHEFGHYAKGSGASLHAVVHSVSHWLWRVAYGRDTCEAWLQERRRHGNVALRKVFLLVSLGVWIGRGLGWLLLLANQLLSWHLGRRLELRADLYSIRLTGSSHFIETHRLLPRLNFAGGIAGQEIERMKKQGKLVLDFPFLTHNVFQRLQSELGAALGILFEHTPRERWDTHPTLADRIRQAQQVNEPGVFQSPTPATSLFADFPALSHRFTKSWIQAKFSLRVEDFAIQTCEDYAAEMRLRDQRRKRTEAYFEDALSIRSTFRLRMNAEPWSERKLSRLRELIEQWPHAIRPLLTDAARKAEDAAFSQLLEVRSHALILRTSLSRMSRRYGTLASKDYRSAFSAMQKDLAGARAEVESQQERLKKIREAFEERMELGLCALAHLASAEPAGHSACQLERAPYQETFPELHISCSALRPMLEVLCDRSTMLLELRALRAELEGFRRDFAGKVFTPDDLAIIQSVAGNVTRMLSELRQALVGIQSPLSSDQRGKDLAEIVVGEIPDSGDLAGTILKAQEVDSEYRRAYKNAMYEIGSALALVEARVTAEADCKAGNAPT